MVVWVYKGMGVQGDEWVVVWWTGGWMDGSVGVQRDGCSRR